jgi:signal transduction histidine kinase
MFSQDARALRPALLLTFAWAAALVVTSALGGWSFQQLGPPFPTAVLLLLPISSAVAVLVGFRAGNVVFVTCLAFLVIYFRSHPTVAPLQLTSRFNLLITMITVQIFAWGFQKTFRRVNDLLRAQQRVIALRIEEHAQLVKALVTDIGACLVSMEPHFRGTQPTDTPALRIRQETLLEIIKRAKCTLVGSDRTELPDPPPDFRAGMFNWIVGLTAVETIVLRLRGFFGGIGPKAPVMVLALVSVGLLLLFRARPTWRPGLALAFALSCQTAVLSSMFFWGFEVVPPGALFVITIAYHAVLIGWRGSVVGIAALNLGMLAYVALRGAADTRGGALFLIVVGLCSLLMQGYWQLMQRMVSRSLDATQQQAAELARIKTFRTRICGTLFHDVANLAQGMGMLVAFDEPLSGEEAQLFQRLHARLGKLVAAANATMTEDAPMLAGRLTTVSLDEVFRDARELFAFRLQQKSQSLVCSLPEPLAVTAQPDLLRDSVLANLLSNAIKFSPSGSAIHLQARRKQAGVEISVRDHGPGFPADLAARLEQQQKVFSTEGSGGETGLGLGLMLTREHLLRMGGRIDLRRSAEGGGEVVIELLAG